MAHEIESCDECDCKYCEGTDDYISIYQTGYCFACWKERLERGEEW